MRKVLAAVLLSLGFCLPSWAGKKVTSVDRDAIKEQIRDAARHLQTQLPELLKAVRVRIQFPNYKCRSPRSGSSFPRFSYQQ